MNSKSSTVMTNNYTAMAGHEMQHLIVPHLFNIVKLTVPRIIDKLLENTEKKSFAIGDYAASDGMTLLPVWKWITEYIKTKKGDEFPITFIFEDQAENNFNTIFTAENGPNSLRSLYPNVHIQACGISYFEQCVASESLDIIICNFGLQWLSRAYCTTTNSILYLYSEVEEERNSFKEQAASDWLTFLEHRSKELVPGGVLIAGQASSARGSCEHNPIPMYALNEAYTCLIKDDVLTQDELDNTNFSFYYRTLEDIKAPFDDVDSTVTKGGLRLAALYNVDINYSAEQDKELFEMVVANKTACIQSCTTNTFLSGLSGNDDEKMKKLNKLYDKMERLLLEYGTSSTAMIFEIVTKLPNVKI